MEESQSASHDDVMKERFDQFMSQQSPQTLQWWKTTAYSSEKSSSTSSFGFYNLKEWTEISKAMKSSDDESESGFGSYVKKESVKTENKNSHKSSKISGRQQNLKINRAEKKKSICTICGKALTHLKQHIDNVHLRVNKCTCEDCQKEFY